MAQILFIALLIAGLAFAGLSLLGALIYDLSLAKINKKASDHPYSRALRKRPKILIAVKAGTNPDQLYSCLQSIAKNSYRKYEIILSSENNKAVSSVVTALSKKYPSKKITIAKDGWWDNNKAEIIIEMSDEYLLPKNALSETAKYFALNKNAEVLLAHTGNVFSYSISSLISQYEYVIKNHWQKTLSTLSRLNINNVHFKAYRGKNSQDRTVFCSNIRVYSAHTQLTRSQNRSAALLFAAGFILINYLIYIAVHSHYAAPLGLVWVGACAYLALNIWSDEHISIVKKLRMLTLTPMISMLFYFKLPLKALGQLTPLRPIR
jgi:hypothetical protein